MALPESSLSVVCGSIQEFLRQGLNATENNIRVIIGAPADAAKGAGEKKHRVNLFFYRFEPSGFESAVHPGEPWRLRLHCLITVFGEVDDHIPAGENELRILGEIMRLFHEHPVMDAVTVNGENIRLQVVYQPVSGDELNHIWSTQSDTSYRPSVAYEMALAVIVPEERRIPPPLVGALGSEIRATDVARHTSFSGDFVAFEVPPREVNVHAVDWAPVICFVHQGECLNSISLAVGSDALDEFNPPSVWIAGDLSATVALQWEIWDSGSGWAEHADTVDATPQSIGIDPQGEVPSSLASVPLPFTAHAGQAVLYATRTYVLEAGGPERIVRSNPLLVTLY